MKTSTKVLLIVATGMLIVGSLLAGSVWVFSKEPIGVYRQDGEWQTLKEHYAQRLEFSQPLDPFDNLTINTQHTNIVIATGEEYTLEFKGYQDPPEVEQTSEGTTITHQSELPETKMEFSVAAGSMNHESYLIITVPKGTNFKHIDCTSRSGSHKISDINVDELTAYSNYGDFTGQNVTSKQMDFTYSSGDIKLLSSSALNLTSRSDYGEIVLDGVAVEKALTIEAQSGDVTIKDSKMSPTAIDGSYGDITVRNTLIDGLTLSTSSGEVSIEGSLTNDSSIHSTYGDVAVSLDLPEEEYGGTLFSQYGDINGRENIGRTYTFVGTGKNLEVSSSSGDVRVTFLNKK